MIIFVLEGDAEDVTQSSEYYDEKYEYLKSMEITELELY